MVTAKKVVEETVEVVVTPPENSDTTNKPVKLISSSKTSDQNVSIITPPQDEDETQPYEPETAPSPPRKEEARKRTAETKEKPPGKRRRRRGGDGGGEGYKRYLFLVMKQVHPDMGISSKVMVILSNLMQDMFERIAEEAARLQKTTARRTLSSREIQGAVKLVLPGELGKHAVAEGNKAVTNYVSYNDRR